MRPDSSIWPIRAGWTIDPVVWLSRVTILVALAAMGAMSWTRNINWDEFYFLSHVHAHLDGRLDLALQTAFVHGFGWLAHVPGHETGQIAAARLVMLGAFAATALAIYRVAAHLTDHRAALVAVVAFVTSGFAVPHGASFRADPMAAALLMWAFAVIMTTPMRGPHILATAMLGALALLVTVKSGLYLPVILVALVWRWDDRGVVLRCLIAGVLAVALAGLLFLWHQAGLSVAEGKAASSKLTEAATVTLGAGQIFPRWPETALWLALTAGPLALIGTGALQLGSRKLGLLLLGCAGPVLAVVIYRNAFPYYFPFAAAPLMIGVAFGARAMAGKPVMHAALALMVLSGGWQIHRAASETAAPQSATIAEVHRLFPKPVPYIDQNGMMASFPRSGFFMSTWGLATYRAAGQPIFADIVAQDQPKFVLANRDELRAALDPAAPPAVGLLPDDIAVLRQSYVHFAGVIWLAGQDAVLEGGAAVVTLPFGGAYRVQADREITINGGRHAAGDVVSLPKGPATITGPDGTQVRLVWHTAHATPQSPLPEAGLYAGFWRL